MKWVRNILFPFVPIYYLVTLVRNWLYDKGFKSSKSYDFPVICVGNLSVGGTGKSPMIEYLIRLLKDNYKLATLSRGYKRNTKGFVLANENVTANTLGDEPFQFYKKFKNAIHVAVGSNRQEGIQQLKEQVNPNVILLDDAFQHRKVNAGLNILLTVHDKLYVDDWMLPTGDLREPVSGAKRANLIVVTKCPNNLAEGKKSAIAKKLNIRSNQHLFFSLIHYSGSVYGENREEDLSFFKGKELTVVTGIANPQLFIDFLREQELNFEHLNFPDHHNFMNKEIKILEKTNYILTTEKDYVRLKQFDSLKEKLFYLPIEFKIDKPKEFEEIIRNFVKS